MDWKYNMHQLILPLVLLGLSSAVTGLSENICAGHENNTHIADAQNCGFFWVCGSSDEKPAMLACSFGFEFNADLGYCLPREAAGCSTKSVCAGIKKYAHVAFSGAPTKYWVCSPGQPPKSKTCANGLTFNAKKGICVQTHLDDEDEQHPCANANGDGMVGDETDCGKYWVCGPGFKPFALMCGYGKHFNNRLGFCQDKAFAGCATSADVGTELEQTEEVGCGECAGQVHGTRLPYANDCTKFCVCQSASEHEVHDCPPSLHFNAVLQACDFQKDAKCPWQAFIDTFEESGCDRCNVTDTKAYIPFIADCSKFCSCPEFGYGNNVEQTCPEGLHFNPELQVCDWPYSAGCQWAWPTQLTGQCDACRTNPPGTKLRYQASCTQFCDCTDFGKDPVKTCPEGTIFNAEWQVCDTPSLANQCIQNPVPTPAQPTKEPVTPTPSNPEVTKDPVTEVPVTERPTKEGPVTVTPVTEGPVTQGPVTESTVTEVPITEGPVTEGPVGPGPEEPVTEGPVTEGPVTEGPVTEGPVTEGPVTEGPVTEGPVTEGPVTEGPVGPGPEEPVTEGPVTEGPVTEGPVTEGPVTEGPVTEGPGPEDPVTEGPVTEGPVTEGPVTEGPVTEGPVGPGPEDPVTEGPTTNAPEDPVITACDGCKTTNDPDKHIPFLDDCTKYCDCAQPQHPERTCHGGRHFNAEMGVCDMPELARCPWA